MPVSLSCLMRYGVAVLATAATLLFRLSLDAVFEDRVVFLPFTLALLVSAWYGGLGPGLLATGLSASVIALVLLPPRWTPTVALLADGLSLVVFALIGMGMSALVEQLHRARRRAEAEAAERKAADEARREHARFIHQVTELSPVVLDVFDLVTERHRYFNSSSVPLYGYTPDEMTQMEDTFSVLAYPRIASTNLNDLICKIERERNLCHATRTMLLNSISTSHSVLGLVRALSSVSGRRPAYALEHPHGAKRQGVQGDR
jgi:PAS domain-containing protein